MALPPIQTATREALAAFMRPDDAALHVSREGKQAGGSDGVPAVGRVSRSADPCSIN
jgi:hypothetical protein